MYLKFTTKLECQNAILEVDKRRNLTGNITVTSDVPREDVEGKYVMKKPKNKHMIEKVKDVRPIKIKNDKGEEVDGIEIVKKKFDEDGVDITVYDGTEYKLKTQDPLRPTHSFVEVESVELPQVEEEG